MACQAYSIRWSSSSSTVCAGGGTSATFSVNQAGSSPAVGEFFSAGATCSAGISVGNTTIYIKIDGVPTLASVLYTVDGTNTANNGKILSIGTCPSPTPSVTPSISITPTKTPSASISATPSITVSMSVSLTPSITPSITPSQLPICNGNVVWQTIGKPDYSALPLTGDTYIFTTGQTYTISQTIPSGFYLLGIVDGIELPQYYTCLDCTTTTNPPYYNVYYNHNQGITTFNFSPPIENPLLAFYSLGNSSINQTFSADTTFARYPYCNPVMPTCGTANPTEAIYDFSLNTISGYEAFGSVFFPGTHSSISIQALGSEYRTNFLWGKSCDYELVLEEPGTGYIDITYSSCTDGSIYRFQYISANTLNYSGLTIHSGPYEDCYYRATPPFTIVTQVDMLPGLYDYEYNTDCSTCTLPSPTPSVTPSITPPPVSPSVTPSVTPSISISVTPSITPSITPPVSPSVTPSITPPVSPSTPCDGVPTPCFSRVFQYSTVSLNTVCVSPFYDQFSFTNLSGTLDVGNVLYLGGCSSCVVAPDGWYIDYTVDLITVFEITGGAGVVTSTTTCPSSAAGTMGYNVFITGTCENPTGAATISPSGGTPPYTVYWSNPLLGYGETKTGLSAGIYQVQLNDSTMPVNNFLNINVSISSGMTVDVTSVSNTTCDLDNGSVTVTALSDYSDITFSLYSGSTVLEFVNTTSFSAVFDNLAPGIYNIIAQNEAGCSATTGNFHIYSSDTVDFGFYIINDTQCASPSGKVYITGTTGNGPFTYLWYNGYTGTSITGLTQGTYEVTVTDSLGCSVSKVALVELVPSIGLGSWSAVNPSCFASDGSLTLTITGGTGPYYYSGSNGTTAISYSPSYTFTSLPAGNYFVEVTDAALCKVTFGTTLLTPGTFNVQSISVIDSECSNNGGSIQVNVQQGSPPYTYSLSGVGVNQSGTTISTSYQFTNLTSQTYDLTITDGGSCVYTNSVTVNNNPSYIVTTSGTTSSCGLENGSITLMITSGGTSPYTYSLDNGNTTTTGNLFATFGGLAAGQYLYTIVDSTGCTQTGNVSVLSEGNVEFSLFPTSCGLSGSGGTITALINSGQPPFTFTWSSNVSGNPQNIYVSGLTGGTYSLTIVDDNGCTQTRETTISCSEIISTYMVYEMCSSDFVYTSGTKRGILQMYNEGYRDLTSGHTDCLLSAATFSVQVTVSGTTYPSPLVPFYNSTSLLDIPTDQQYFNEVESILLSIPGITGVTIDSTTSEIIISTDGSLSAEEIVIELIIDYDIDCVS